MKKLAHIGMVLALVAALFGCTNMNKTQQGALSGGVVGAGAGAAITAIAGGNAGVGAALGGVVGGLAGGLYGHQEDMRNQGY
ncbi:glycine zipper domain-containing protein [Desulfovibrio inopinatus]|uniref:glycine zipper domain-containing protein n=1 Tax=Desulfovibrio inopinatus TaxID=102109 RepID=UPI00040B4744|nr:glycine zipper domain-containing protein [Desulfovibrio inopinatus]